MTDLRRDLQERAARALPAEQVVLDGGWWLRHAPGCAWWVGTVLPHGGTGPGDVVRRVARATAFHAARGTVPGFQITPGAYPDGLDALLARRGYRRLGPMSLQVATTALVGEAATPGAPPVRVDGRPSPPWFDAWRAGHGDEGDAAAERAMRARVALPSGHACARLGDRVVAVGRAVVDGGWAGVFDVATRPEVRGRGAARAVLAALARWAAEQGAQRMYLQVEGDNAPARRLYAQVGFRELCSYHYRAAGSDRTRPGPAGQSSRAAARRSSVVLIV